MKLRGRMAATAGDAASGRAEGDIRASPVPTDKVAVIDQKRLFERLPKTKAYDSQLKKEARIEEEFQRLIKRERSRR
jgi:hypothetical protein